MNLNKYTKAELISKFKKLELKKGPTINQVNIKSYFKQLWELLLTFKTLVLKLTLISLILNLYKRYSIFSKLWRILTSVVMFIFGLNIIDKELKYISNNIVYYITQTKFYQYLTDIFKGTTKEIPIDKSEQPIIATRESKNFPGKNSTDESRISESHRGSKESVRDSKISDHHD